MRLAWSRREAHPWLHEGRDATEAELIGAPVSYLNGADDDWWHPAPETRHL